MGSQPQLIRRHLRQSLLSSRRTSLILKLSFRSWSKKKLAGIILSRVSMMRLLIKMRSLTSSIRKRNIFLSLEPSLPKIYKEHLKRLITLKRSNRSLNPLLTSWRALLKRRKIEGELKMAQETVADIERTKKELEAAIMRKDTEIGGLVSKLDDEQSLVGKVQKSVKELQGRIEEMEEELEAERQARAKAERQRSDLAREMESLGERLNEASGATSAQIELNKKRESEVTKLRKDLEECVIQHEATLVSLKKKQADSIAEMSEQMDQLNKMKGKVTKDCGQIMNEIGDVRAATDEVTRSKASAEKSHGQLIAKLNDMSKKIA